MVDKIRDGHIHTPFCPHGTKDSFEAYVEEAMGCNKKEISFTEHFPLPQNITTVEFQKECALLEEQVEEYIKAVKAIKKKYDKQIKINIGFEVDYIEGKEREITCLLDKYGEYIEDSILSVHFLKLGNQYYAVDYLPEFEILLEKLGSIEAIYDLYFETVLKSLQADLGRFKPKRIGHPTLVRIFNKKYPFEYKKQEILTQIIEKMAQDKYEIDYNVAGLRKVYCGEVYPSGILLKLAKEQNIKMVYGTDSHSSHDIRS